MADELSSTRTGKHGHSRDSSNLGADDVFAAENALVNQRVIQLSFFHVATRKCVFFNGMITNFSDSFSSNWNKENVYGRMDPLMIFQNTERSISLGWVVPSVSEEHAKANLHKFEHLSSLLYPTYKRKNASVGNLTSDFPINTMESSPLIRVKFTNLIHGAATGDPASRSARDGGLLAAISGFNFNPNLDQGFYNPRPGILYPKEYSVDCQMTVLHEHALGWDSENSEWLAGEGNDKYPYGISELTGHISICKNRGLPPQRPRKNDSKSNKSISDNLKRKTLR
jgi:hypothetical protein